MLGIITVNLNRIFKKKGSSSKSFSNLNTATQYDCVACVFACMWVGMYICKCTGACQRKKNWERK